MISKRTKKIIALFLAINLLADCFFPTAALALTSGPSQPEVQSFTPVSTSDMVDVFSGDFNYNIPLLDVEGYPVNLSYDAGITNDQEASWVGLGWNINPGVINRNMRSIPDDFSGDKITKEMNVKANQTIGISYRKNLELFGKDKKNQLSLNAGIKYNNYTGFATDLGANLSTRLHAANSDGFTGSLGLNSGSQSGLGISPGISYTKSVKRKEKSFYISGSANLHLSTGQGLQAVNYGYTEQGKTAKSTTLATGGSYSFANPTYTPHIENEMCNLNLSFDLSFGAEAIGLYPKSTLSAYYTTQFLKKKDGQQ